MKCHTIYTMSIHIYKVEESKGGDEMEKLKELSFQEIMQLNKDIEEFENDFGMIFKMMDIEEIKTILKQKS